MGFRRRKIYSIQRNMKSCKTFSMISLICLKPTYRTKPEQLLGLSIFLAFSFLNYFYAEWIGAGASFFWTAYHFLVPVSIWILWRRVSIYTLKLEISLFLTQLGFQFLWCFSHFYLQEPLLSLFALLFLFCNSILCILLFGKKEKLAKYLLFPASAWILYVAAINMAFT